MITYTSSVGFADPPILLGSPNLTFIFFKRRRRHLSYDWPFPAAVLFQVAGGLLTFLPGSCGGGRRRTPPAMAAPNQDIAAVPVIQSTWAAQTIP